MAKLERLIVPRMSFVVLSMAEASPASMIVFGSMSMRVLASRVAPPPSMIVTSRGTSFVESTFSVTVTSSVSRWMEESSIGLSSESTREYVVE